jgi:hypothetical protein
MLRELAEKCSAIWYKEENNDSEQVQSLGMLHNTHAGLILYVWQF